MGSSSTDFRDARFWTGDSGLQVWLFLLARELEQLTARPQWLDEAIAHWRDHAKSGAIGCVDAALDRFCTSQNRIDLVVAGGNRVLEWLRGQAPYLSKDLLNSFKVGGRGSRFTKDVDVDYYIRVGTAFVDILMGRIGPPPPGGMNFINSRRAPAA